MNILESPSYLLLLPDPVEPDPVPPPEDDVGPGAGLHHVPGAHKPSLLLLPLCPVIVGVYWWSYNQKANGKLLTNHTPPDLSDRCCDLAAASRDIQDSSQV